MAYKDPEVGRAKARAYYYANRDSVLAKQKVFYATNRDRIAAQNAAYKKAHPEATLRRNRKYQGVLDAHGERKTGACEICAVEGALHLDHDHETGKIRGWLCNRCNQGLGYFSDNPAHLQRAATYIEKSRTT